MKNIHTHRPSQAVSALVESWSIVGLTVCRINDCFVRLILRPLIAEFIIANLGCVEVGHAYRVVLGEWLNLGCVAMPCGVLVCTPRPNSLSRERDPPLGQQI